MWRCLVALLSLQEAWPGASAPPAPEVADVRIRGSRRVPQETIRDAIKTRPDAPLRSETVRSDLRAIWRLGAFENVEVKVEETPSGALVTFLVTEKPAIGRVLVTGNREVDLESINGVLDIERGEILDAIKIRHNAEKIADLYRQQGHHLVNVGHELVRRGTRADVLFRIQENARVQIGRINFVGNAAFPDARLGEVIASREPNLFSIVTDTGTFQEEVLERDLLLLNAFYFDRGYVHARVGPPKVEILADGTEAFITIPISEGRPYRLGKIALTGDLLKPAASMRATLPLRVGTPFSRSAVGKAVADLTKQYRDSGFAYVNVTPETTVREDARMVDLTFDIDRGPAAFIQRIDVTGNTKTRDRVIRRELRLREGDRFSQSALDRSREKILALGHFRSVNVSTTRGTADDRMNISIAVVERPTGSFQVGAGFSSVESFLVQAQITEYNLFGRGQTLALQTQLSSLRRLFVLQFQEPYFLGTPWTFGFSVYDQQRVYLSFVRASVGGSVGWGYHLTDHLRLFASHTLEKVELSARGSGGFLSFGGSSRSSGVIFARLADEGRTSAPQLSLVYDTRNDRFLTTRGWLATASVEIADPYTGSQNTFARSEASVRHFRPLLGPLILRLRMLGGFVVSRKPGGVPLFERYFPGGIFDVRGFRPRSLGPRILIPSAPSSEATLSTLTIGGNAQLVANAELEFPIYGPLGIRGVLFTDAGNAFNIEDQHCQLSPPAVPTARNPCNMAGFLTALRTSWGFGLRWLSPIGPLRFEWGFPFRTLPGEESTVFEFTLGNAF